MVAIWKTLAACPACCAPSAAERLVLLCYAEHANPQRIAWPSHRLVAAETGLARTTVAGAVRCLIRAGWLRIAGRFPRGVVKYEVLAIEARCRLTRQVEGDGGVVSGDRRCRLRRQEVSSQATGNEPVTEPVIEPLSPPGVSGGQHPLRQPAGEREIRKADDRTAGLQLPLLGSAADHVQVALAGLDEDDRAEVLVALRAWIGQEHGARAVARWARKAAARGPGWLASRECPRAYVAACLAREARAVAEDEAREEAQRAAEEVRRREADRACRVREDESRRASEESKRLKEQFLGLEDREREALVAEAIESVHPAFRASLRPDRATEGLLGRRVLRLVRERTGTGH